MNKKVLFTKVFRSGWLLATFALVGVVLLNIVKIQTEDKIVENERADLMARLMEVVDTGSHDNDLLTDTIQLPAERLQSSKAVTVYRARKQGQPTAAIFVITTSKGYKGTIQMVVGVRMDKTLSGVRVAKHTETPGLGDKMDIQKGNWILSFNNTSLNQPVLSKWAVKKDGGYFDQFTGATITPRAIVGAVRNVLVWVNEGDNLSSVFSLEAEPTLENKSPNRPQKTALKTPRIVEKKKQNHE